jgi:hypothetical protein
MRTICLMAVGIFISAFSIGQVQPVNPPDLTDLNPIVGTIKIPALPSAKFMYEAPLGKVYAMAPDNMPCLVPNFPVENAMPVYKIPFESSIMPNAIPRQQFPPAPFFNNGLLKIYKTPKAVSKNLMLDLVRKK